jgi:hypothetical protein
MKDIIKYIKENPAEAISDVVFLLILGLVFYVSIWTFCPCP